jgi:alpha-glucosidase
MHGGAPVRERGDMTFTAEQPDTRSASASLWWRDALVYQIYPRSFQDSDGDGLGDLEGVRSRLDYVQWLGADAIWLNPIYPSPGADCGFDVTDHTSIDPRLGTEESFAALLDDAHARGIRVLLDLVPSHTSTEHPWFREHPDWYVRTASGPPNNWRSPFAGQAWSRDDARGDWYLHSFYAEEADLDWRNPAVHSAIAEVIATWRERGVDGFRVDAVERMVKDPLLRDDPPANAPPVLPLEDGYGLLEHVHSRNGEGVGDVLGALRAAAGDTLLAGEVFLPTRQLEPYLEHLDLVFAFEPMFAAWEPEPVARAVEHAAGLERVLWVLGSHDFSRPASRIGEENTRLAALLQLTLPGPAVVYQGDELGLVDGPGASPPHDRAGRDASRHPMQWEPVAGGGFTSGRPWLAPVDPERRNVRDQADDASSLLSLYRRLIGLRRALGSGFELREATDVLLVYRRGEHLVRLNFGDGPLPLLPGEVVVLTTGCADEIPGRGGVVTRPA